jgi:hypothetical protein
VQNATTLADAVAALLNGPLATQTEPAGVMAVLAEALMPAVPLPVAQRMLGDKARSEMYREAGNGRLEFLKDNGKTLVTTRSILNYQRTYWKPLAIKPAKLKARAAARRARVRKKNSGVT